MVAINATPRIMSDGTKLTSYSNTVGTTKTTYTFDQPQEAMTITNKGLKPIIYTAGSRIDVTLNQSETHSFKEIFSSFDVQASEGVQQFEILTDEDGTAGGTGDAVITALDAKVSTLTADVGSFSSSLAQLATEIEQGGGGSTIVSNLKDKTWYAIGDSLTEVNYRSSKNYHKYISEWTGCTVSNYGLSGRAYASTANVIDGITGTPDLVTVFLGTNDWGTFTKPLGVFGDVDNTTIAGCIDIVLTKLITKYPTKKIAVFTPIPRSNNWGSNATANASGYTLEQLVDLIIKICKHYSIPCLDLYHGSNLHVWNATANATYFGSDTTPAGDGLHPNHLGHEIIAYKMLDFLNSIVGVSTIANSETPPTGVTDTTAPVLTITPAGTFTETQTVSMSTNETATIYYTLDDSDPKSSGTKLTYSNPLTLTATDTIKAYARDTAGNESAVQTVTYTKQASGMPAGVVTNGAVMSLTGANGSGTTWLDDSGNGNNATVTGTGFSNGALQIQTAGDLATILDSPLFPSGTSDYTFEVYMKFDSLGTTAVVPFLQTGGTPNQSIGLMTSNNAGQYYRATFAHSGATVLEAISTTASDTNWHQVINMRRGNDLLLFVDGVQKATKDVTGLSLNNSPGKFIIGAINEAGANRMTGQFKAIRFYNRALTNEEITQNLNASIA